MYEYKVVPAPVRTAKVKGLKSTAERFAHALAERINAEAGGGWQFWRTESLSCETRTRFGRSKTSVETVMIFARPVGTVRPEAGAALAAAQEALAGFSADTPIQEEPRYEPQAEVQEYHPAAYEPEPVAHDEGYAPEPHIEPEPVAPAPLPRSDRQEPLFRASPMMRPEHATRPEPILRPRAARHDDSDEQ